MPKAKPLGQRIKKAREAAGLTRREFVRMVPKLKGEGDLLQLEVHGKHVASHELIKVIKKALKM